MRIKQKLWTGLGAAAVAGTAAVAATATVVQAASPSVTGFPSASGRLEVPFSKALTKMLGGEGGEGGIGFTRAGPAFEAPALDDSQLRAALPGNTIRKDLAVAFYFAPDGTVEGWKRDWSRADASKCPTPHGDNYDVDDGVCWTAITHVIKGRYRIDHGRVCMPSYSGKPEDGTHCYYVGFVTSYVLIGDGTKLYGSGKSLVHGKHLEARAAQDAK